jgi:hypothetical protein
MSSTLSKLEVFPTADRSLGRSFFTAGADFSLSSFKGSNIVRINNSFNASEKEKRSSIGLASYLLEYNP